MAAETGALYGLQDAYLIAMPIEMPSGSMKLRAFVSMKMFIADRDCSAFGSFPESNTTISQAHHSPSMNSAAPCTGLSVQMTRQA